MVLSRRNASFLLVVAGWTAFVWVVLIINISRDHAAGHGLAFHLVHYVLAVIALGLDVGVTVIGVRGLRGRPGQNRQGGQGEPVVGVGQRAPVPAEITPRSPQSRRP